MEALDMMLWGVIVVLIVILWRSMVRFYEKTLSVQMSLIDKLENLQMILLDVRDGTKSFQREKRSSARIHDYIVARILDGDADEYIPVVNLSYEGALLRTSQTLNKDMIIRVELFLPLHSQPIDVKARVVKVVPVPKSEGTVAKMDVGIEFLGLNPADKEKVIKEVDGMKNR